MHQDYTKLVHNLPVRVDHDLEVFWDEVEHIFTV